MKKLIDDRVSQDIVLLSQVTNESIIGYEFQDGKRTAIIMMNHHSQIVTLYSDASPTVIEALRKPRTEDSLRVAVEQRIDSYGKHMHSIYAFQDYPDLYRWLGVPVKQVLSERFKLADEAAMEAFESHITFGPRVHNEFDGNAVDVNTPERRRGIDCPDND